MEIEEAVTQLLLADATLSAAIGGPAAPRLYPQDAALNDALPLVLYVTNDPERGRAMGRFMNAYKQTFRFDCYGSRVAGAYSSAKLVAKHVRRVLFDFFRGLCGNGTINVKGVFDAGGEDGLQEPLYAEEEGVDYVAVMVRVAWETV